MLGYRDKLNLDDDFDPEWIYGNNLKRIETVIKKIIEIEELREEKLAKSITEQI